MTDANVRVAIIVSVAALLAMLILFVGLYTKAQNDQAYLQIVGENTSEEGFEEYLQERQLAGFQS